MSLHDLYPLQSMLHLSVIGHITIDSLQALNALQIRLHSLFVGQFMVDD